MNKLVKAGIGIVVIGTVLTIIFGINHRKNRETMEALQPGASVAAEFLQESAASSAVAPVTDGIVYEAKNQLHPGMAFQEEGSVGAENPQDADPVGESREYQSEEGILTWQGENYKRNAHVKADLLMGIDDFGSADFLAVGIHDTSKDTLKLLMIPRDAMMEMYETDVEGHVTPVVTHIKFSYAGQGTPQERASRTVDAVETLLCGTKVDHYMAGGIPMLAQINDLAGGVAVTVPNDELKKVNPEWTKGETIVLHGNEVESFIRYRDIDAEGTPLVRMDQHRAYITGFYKRLREDRNLTVKVSDFIEENVTTDMSKGEYEKLLLDGLSCDFDSRKDIQILPGSMRRGVENDGSVLDQFYVDYENAVPVLLDLFYRKVS